MPSALRRIVPNWLPAHFPQSFHSPEHVVIQTTCLAAIGWKTVARVVPALQQLGYSDEETVLEVSYTPRIRLRLSSGFGVTSPKRSSWRGFREDHALPLEA